MLCGKCWRDASGGVPDGDADHPHYRYGGLWKNRRAARHVSTAVPELFAAEPRVARRREPAPPRRTRNTPPRLSEGNTPPPSPHPCSTSLVSPPRLVYVCTLSGVASAAREGNPSRATWRPFAAERTHPSALVPAPGPSSGYPPRPALRFHLLPSSPQPPPPRRPRTRASRRRPPLARPCWTDDSIFSPGGKDTRRLGISRGSSTRTRARATEHGRAERLRVTRPHVPGSSSESSSESRTDSASEPWTRGDPFRPRALARAANASAFVFVFVAGAEVRVDTSTVADPRVARSPSRYSPQNPRAAAARVDRISALATPRRRALGGGASSARGASRGCSRRQSSTSRLRVSSGGIVQTRHVHRRAVCRRRDVRVAGARTGTTIAARGSRATRRRSKPRAPGAGVADDGDARGDGDDDEDAMVTTTEDADAAVAALAASWRLLVGGARADSGSTRPLANAAAAPRTPRESPRGSSRVVADASSPLVARRNAASRRETPRTVASSRGARETRPRRGRQRRVVARVPGGSGDGDRGDGASGDGDHGDGDEAPGDGASGDDGDRGDGNHGDAV